MAGKEVYLGKMIEALQTDMASMSADMLQVVTELQAVNVSIGQSMSSGNIKSGVGNQVILNDVNVTATNQVVSIGKVKSFAKGKLKFSVEAKKDGTSTSSVVYKKNGGADVTVLNNVNGVYNTVSIDIDVDVLDEIQFNVTSGAVGTVGTVKANTAVVSWDIVNLVSDGLVIKS